MDGIDYHGDLLMAAASALRDSYDRVRLGDDAWWVLTPAIVQIQQNGQVRQAMVFAFSVFAHGPIIGGGPVGSTPAIISNPLALLDIDSIDYFMREGLEEVRRTRTSLLDMQAGTSN